MPGFLERRNGNDTVGGMTKSECRSSKGGRMTNRVNPAHTANGCVRRLGVRRWAFGVCFRPQFKRYCRMNCTVA